MLHQSGTKNMYLKPNSPCPAKESLEFSITLINVTLKNSFPQLRPAPWLLTWVAIPQPSSGDRVAGSHHVALAELTPVLPSHSLKDTALPWCTPCRVSLGSQRFLFFPQIVFFWQTLNSQGPLFSTHIAVFRGLDES